MAVNEQTGKSEAGAKILGAFLHRDDRRIYAHTSADAERDAAIAYGKGNLWRSVLSCSQLHKRQQLCAQNEAKELLWLDPQL